MRVGVRVDEAGMNETACGVDLAGAHRRSKSRSADLADRVAVDQNVGNFGGAGGDVEHPSAAQNRIAHRTSPSPRSISQSRRGGPTNASPIGGTLVEPRSV